MKHSTTAADEATGRDCQTRIDFALSELSEIERYAGRVAAKRADLESTLIQTWRDFDPLNDEQLFERAEIRNLIQILDSWLPAPPPLLRAIETLRQELLKAKPVIQSLAQARCSEESTIEACFWSKRLVGLELQPIANQVATLREIAREVCAGLKVVLETRRGIPLNPDEKRTGIFHRGQGLGHRPLSFEERSAGIALE